MSHRSFHLHLDAYLSVREALGFQMRAERTCALPGRFAALPERFAV